MEASLLEQEQEQLSSVSGISELMQDAVQGFDQDPKIAALPRVLLMGPRRAGKTSIQVSASLCLSLQTDGGCVIAAS